MNLRHSLARLLLFLGVGAEAQHRAEQERRAGPAERARRSLTADAMLSEGPLPLALLALVAEGPNYGYGLTRRLNELGFSFTRERAVYPALGRMEVAGLPEGYLAASRETPARKYYRVLPEGERALARARGQWRELSGALGSLLEGPK